jgi:hypothetical protein
MFFDVFKYFSTFSNVFWHLEMFLNFFRRLKQSSFDVFFPFRRQLNERTFLRPDRLRVEPNNEKSRNHLFSPGRDRWVWRRWKWERLWKSKNIATLSLKFSCFGGIKLLLFSEDMFVIKYFPLLVFFDIS